MQLHISANDGVPIYLQIVNQVKYLVAAGRLKPGEELPPIRVLAKNLIVNPNTVARAYRELEAAGVVGLVGANGAGKTTLIKHVLGLLRAAEGSVRVFGRDPVADPVGVLAHVGYLSEENDLPGWMRVAELLRYTRAFYPGWDDAYAERLRRDFELDPAARIKHLSKGQRERAGLLIALAYRPALLVLDAASSGPAPAV